MTPLGASEEPTKRRPRYQPHPKHKHIPSRGPKGSLCPRGMTMDDAQRLLDESIPEKPPGRHRYAFRDGQWFGGLPGSPSGDVYHGYPVEEHEVPPCIIKKAFENRLKT